MFLIEVKKLSAVDGNDKCLPSATCLSDMLGSGKLDFFRDLYGTKRGKMQRLYSC